jgi:hypothetical protein
MGSRGDGTIQGCTGIWCRSFHAYLKASHDWVPAGFLLDANESVTSLSPYTC